MTDYCTDQFLLTRYPNGAGGKFILTSLCQFDAVAHWDAEVDQKQREYLDWFSSIWPDQLNQWVTFEPNQPWELNFYSRRWFRNNNLTCKEFNQHVDRDANSYFHQQWQQKHIITDHWHKTTVPDFFQKARWIELLLPCQDLETYKKLVRNKLYLWQEDSQTVISTMDHPDYAWDEKTRKNSIAYQNQYELTDHDTYDDFFYNWLLEQHWVKPFVNQKPDPQAIASIELGQLIDVDGYIALMKQLSDYFGESGLNTDQLKHMHTIWKEKSQIDD